MKKSARIYVSVHYPDGRFRTAYWPTRKVVVKNNKATIHYWAKNQVTYDLAHATLTQVAGTWEGPLNGSGILPS